MSYIMKRALCIISLFSLMLAACGQKQAVSDSASNNASEEGLSRGTIPVVHEEEDITNASTTEEEIRISSDNLKDDNRNMDQHKIIDNQSFDVDLQGWGAVRFVSCEPNDVLDVPHFYLTKDGEIVYTFSWEDRTGTPGIFDSVRFVSFPDIDGDGRKDVIVSVGKMFENRDSRIPYNVISVYFNRGDRFEPADSITDQVNEVFVYGEAEYADVMELVSECVAGTSTQATTSSEHTEADTVSNQAAAGEILAHAAGSWLLDGEKTTASLRQYKSLQEMFGTGIHQGAGLEISESGEMSYYIGIGVGGTGQCEVLDGSITVAVTPYEDHGDYDHNLILRLVTEDKKECLVMDYVNGEEIYWHR